ncbi:MAG: transglutaminase-like domain-containing protein [Fimbriimonas sp.]|nr:transglutaminase-like domain-containing protein [Fimbriimonas sp.]
MVLLALLSIFQVPQTIDREPKEEPVYPQFYHRPTHGPTLSEFIMRLPVNSRRPGVAGIVTFPAPSNYSGQTLVSFAVFCQPANALKGWAWRDRKDGLNSVIEAQVAPDANGAVVGYSAKVLLPSEPVLRTMVRQFKPWLGSTLCVQASDPKVKSLAIHLKEGNSDTDEFVHRTVMWVAKNKPSLDSSLNGWDATSGLSGGGNSLNRANLCAAILRAAGVAARTVAYLPTWVRGAFAEQWLTEYWSDNGSWSMIEPTLGVVHPARNTAIVLAIAGKEDEDQASDSLPTRAANTGTPLLSTPQVSSELEVSSSSMNLKTTEIYFLKSFPKQSEPRVMSSGFRRSLRVRAAARLGRNSELDEQATLNAISKNPGEFWRLLDQTR